MTSVESPGGVYQSSGGPPEDTADLRGESGGDFSAPSVSGGTGGAW